MMLPDPGVLGVWHAAVAGFLITSLPVVEWQNPPHRQRRRPVLAQPLLSQFAVVGAVRRDSLPPTTGPEPTPGRAELPVTPAQRRAAGLPG